MKRLHIHVSVERLDASVRFYSTLFASDPTVIKPDYAKWMLDDPHVNFAISTRSGTLGLDHLSMQVETPDELNEVYGRLGRADAPVLDEGMTTCCYARSEKSWITDPQGLSWETFLTTGESTVYGDNADLGPIRTASVGNRSMQTCCGSEPEPADASCCG